MKEPKFATLREYLAHSDSTIGNEVTTTDTWERHETVETKEND